VHIWLLRNSASDQQCRGRSVGDDGPPIIVMYLIQNLSSIFEYYIPFSVDAVMDIVRETVSLCADEDLSSFPLRHCYDPQTNGTEYPSKILA